MSPRDFARLQAAAAARTWVALVHHPVYDRNRRVVTTAITNLDIHDIARSSRTFGAAGYLIVTPVAAQRELATRILGHWHEPTTDGDVDDGGPRNEYRREALAPVAVADSIEAAEALVAERAGGAPTLLVATTARQPARSIDYPALARLVGEGTRPMLLLFGTGWGLADRVLDRVDHTLTPIRGHTDYNHLSVRSAAAIVLDRLFGARDTVEMTGIRGAQETEGAEAP